ncbi:RNA polymerase II subunit A [Parasponia andersonii]|uniref:RNA polymerase II subunit A C-terminal domain phosphatase SSU72 n=1 Tax=Parasponia andersonii TaxID=3476 RepID=A0A2P5AYC1_PARAD|nr:RNA polymerase II subunit A [Parasponia andersonii]
MKYRYAMVCSSNQNRSMEAHSLLKRQGFDVSSYGTGAHVKLPGPSLREPNVYGFGTPYKHMFDDLRRKDPELYKRNGILPMLKRNSTVKTAPQRWQDNAADGTFDVVFTFEEKVFDMVIEGVIKFDPLIGDQEKLENCVVVISDSTYVLFVHNLTTADLHTREHVLMKSVLVINLEVKDNHEEAAVGARLALDLCQEIEETEMWEDSIDDVVAAFEKQHRRKLLYSISFY